MNTISVHCHRNRVCDAKRGELKPKLQQTHSRIVKGLYPVFAFGRHV